LGRKKKRIAVIDSETDPFLYGRTPKPFVWGFYDGETYIHFWGDDCTEQLIDYLKDEEDLIIYAHNGGKFDFFYMLNYLDADISLINGRIAKATLFNKKIELRDSYLILPLPLSAHGKDDIDYNKMEAAIRETHKAEILRYLQTDCTSLFDWVKNFRDQFGGGLTLAGSAFKQLKKTEYPYQPTGLSFDETFRPYYSGGRVQCFEVGAFVDDLIYVDIHSAYPYAMTFNHWTGSQYRETLRIPDRENGSYYCKIDAVSKGALPFKVDNDTYYPSDDIVRTYYCSGWEVLSGLKTNTLFIKKVHRVYLPTFTADFCAYVDKFFAMKANADIERAKHSEGSAGYRHWDAIRTFAKLMLNSCYGKFGQDGRKFEAFILCEYGDVPDPYLDRGELKRWKSYAEAEGFISIFNRPDPVESFYNVATAASITGFVRAYLWENICKSDGVLYCDTDSIICRKFGGVISPALGDWGVEARLSEAYIAQKKMYALRVNPVTPIGAIDKTKTASKGVRLTFDQIKNGVLSRENIHHTKDAPAFSLKFGARFTQREINFKNLQENACTNPPDNYNCATRGKKPSKTITRPLVELFKH
jgi:hypothetical protein